MTTDSTVVYQADGATRRRTLLVGIRLFLAADTMMMGAMIFAYLYLRSNNYANMWRPSGIDDLSGIGMTVILVLQAACLLAVVAAARAAMRGGAYRVAGVVALVLGLASGVVRVWYQYHLGNGWVINNGTYTAVSEMWLGILIVQLLLAVIWLFTIVLPGPRAADAFSSATHLRAFAELWGYLLVVSTFVFLLVRLV